MTDAQYKPVHWVNEFIFLLKPVRNKVELKKKKSHTELTDSSSLQTYTPFNPYDKETTFHTNSFPFEVHVKCKLESQDGTEYNKS